MKLRIAYVVQAVFGVLVAGALSFGASQAFASGQAVEARTCPDRGVDYAYSSCGVGCPGGRGYCAAGGICACGAIP